MITKKEIEDLIGKINPQVRPDFLIALLDEKVSNANLKIVIMDTKSPNGVIKDSTLHLPQITITIDKPEEADVELIRKHIYIVMQKLTMKRIVN